MSQQLISAIVTLVLISVSCETSDSQINVGSNCKISKTKQLLPKISPQIMEKEIEFESPGLLLSFLHELNKIKIETHPSDPTLMISDSIDNAILLGIGFPLGLQSLNDQILLSHSTYYHQAQHSTFHSSKITNNNTKVSHFAIYAHLQSFATLNMAAATLNLDFRISKCQNEIWKYGMGD